MTRWWQHWFRRPAREVLPLDPLGIVHYLHALADEASPTGVITLTQRDIRRSADTIADLLAER